MNIQPFCIHSYKLYGGAQQSFAHARTNVKPTISHPTEVFIGDDSKGVDLHPISLGPSCGRCTLYYGYRPLSALVLQVSVFEGTCYMTPLIGAYLADSKWGRYKTILVFSTIYLVVSTLGGILVSTTGNFGTILCNASIVCMMLPSRRRFVLLRRRILTLHRFVPHLLTSLTYLSRSCLLFLQRR